jgi:hypothetical protein
MRTQRERMTMKTNKHWVVLCVVLLTYIIGGYFDTLVN